MLFILESQAKAEGRAKKADVRMDRAEARMDRAEARANAMEKRLDKRMDSIAKLLRQGMRMQVRNEAAIAELAAVQKETHRELRAFIRSLRNGRGSHNGN